MILTNLLQLAGLVVALFALLPGSPFRHAFTPVRTSAPAGQTDPREAFLGVLKSLLVSGLVGNLVDLANPYVTQLIPGLADLVAQNLHVALPGLSAAVAAGLTFLWHQVVTWSKQYGPPTPASK